MEVPAYQSIDILLGKHKNPTLPARGFYISAADDEGRAAVSNGFAYTEEEADQKAALMMQASKYPKSVMLHSCWIHNEGGQLYWTPR